MLSGGGYIVLIYHGSTVIVDKPEIRIAKFHKDFYYGFYCTEAALATLRFLRGEEVHE